MTQRKSPLVLIRNFNLLFENQSSTLDLKILRSPLVPKF